MRRYHCVYQTILVAIAHQYVAVKKGIMAANEMKILECTLLSDRKRIKVIVSHPHIGQNDRTNQSKGTDSGFCQDHSDMCVCIARVGSKLDNSGKHGDWK